VETSSLSQRFVCCGEGTADGDCNSNTNRDSNSKSCHRLLRRLQPPTFNAHTNSDAETSSNTQTVSEATANSDFSGDTDRPKGTTRNQCDYQQLYRELEECKWCDRLQIGCVHHQVF